jgi:hypothetical protein
VLVASLAGPAEAAQFADSATGFAVDPPAPFVVRPAKSQSYDVAVAINSLTGTPALGIGDNYLCQVGFKAEAASADLTQEEINLQVSRPEWLDNAAAALSKTFDVTGKQTFVLAGATGIELVGQPKGGSPGADVFVSIVDTPKGRTTLNCATRQEDMAAALNPFRLIRASITPPGTAAR